MKFLERLRNVSFWSLDYLKGGKVLKHYNDIKFITENYNKSKAIREKYLNNILTHAVSNTEYYKTSAHFKSLKDFPVINKNTVLDNFEQFKAKSYITKKSKLISTSGSTGVPLKLIHDSIKKNRNTADTIYFSELSGFKVGYKLLLIRHWRAAFIKSPILSWMQNIRPIEVVDLNDKNISKLITSIEKDSSSLGLLSNASALEMICKYLDKVTSKSIKSNLTSIIANSEALNHYTKQAMKKYFNVVTVSRYSNMENGLLAMQKMDNNNEFQINWASYYIEILKLDSNMPVHQGEMGRIVVTDYFNHAMPLIRYDTGDIGAFKYNSDPPEFDKVEGRKSDVILKTNGDILSSLIIGEVNSFSGIKQSQLIQETKNGYKIVLNVNSKFKHEKELINKFKSFLGDDAEVIIEYVNEIPLLNSGKRKTTINNYLTHTNS
ncbi:CoF synthetase [Algibacter mikhailovii]|uniref:CoF synthetase n=1 Tax=Algibacter mikhailovii TaxID=425498 RepID=UPI0024945B68|nr:CoF synthetase [Algibacter mikhailovii]